MKLVRVSYLFGVHVLAVLGVLYVMMVISGGIHFSAHDVSIRSQGAFSPNIPGLPKQPVSMEAVFVGDQQIGRLWFVGEDLDRVEFGPPDHSTMCAMARSQLDSARSTDRNHVWSTLTEQYATAEDRWTGGSMPILSVSDKKGLGVPNLAILWKGTTVVRTLKESDIWANLTGDEALSRWLDSDEYRNASDHGGPDH